MQGEVARRLAVQLPRASLAMAAECLAAQEVAPRAEPLVAAHAAGGTKQGETEAVVRVAPFETVSQQRHLPSWGARP